MERELWSLLYPLLRRVGHDFHQKYVQFQPWVIVAVTLWAALQDRPLCWACNPRNWGRTTLRPLRLPSASVVSRRAYGVAVGLCRRALEQAIRASGHPALVAFIDGKPLSIPAISHDPDAGFGRGAGQKSKGYKLHAVISTRGMPEAWEITPIQTAETKVAEQLVGQLEYGGYLLGDANYDANGVFDAAAAKGYAVRAIHKRANAGQGHRYQSPHRQRSIDAASTEFSKALRKTRGEIERQFATLASFGCGLKPLPAWVRRLHRVRIWVWDKLLINAARILRKQRLMASLQ
jgi:IS5 family transposase